jgi:MYXO-CTERM domain-containing protein
MLARLSVVGILLGVAMPASAQVLADSMADFSGTQGADGWHYGYYAGDMSPGSFQEMQVFQSNRWYVQPGEYWTSLGAALSHPNGTVTSPPADAVDQWSARRWVSDFAGEVNIDTTLFKINANTHSNGVMGHIYIDGQEIWNQFIAGDDAVGVATTLTASIHPGSTIDFVLDPVAGNDGGDATHFAGVISAVPTPGSLALLGIAGIVASRRRRSA